MKLPLLCPSTIHDQRKSILTVILRSIFACAFPNHSCCWFPRNSFCKLLISILLHSLTSQSCFGADGQHLFSHHLHIFLVTENKGLPSGDIIVSYPGHLIPTSSRSSLSERAGPVSFLHSQFRAMTNCKLFVIPLSSCIPATVYPCR